MSRVGLLFFAMSLTGCSKYITTHRALGDVHFKNHEYREAIAEYDKAMRFGANDVPLVRQLGLAHYAVGDVGEAFRILSSVEQLDSSDTQTRLLLGNLFIAARRPDDALREANEIQRLEPQNPDGYALAGSAYSSKQDFQNASVAYRRVAELQPGNPTPSILLGESLLASGQTTEAERAFESALSRNRNDLPTLAKLISLYIKDHRSAEASALLQSRIAAAAAPSATQKGGEADRAYLARLNDLLGTVRSAEGENAAAEAAFRESMKMDSSFVEPRLHLAALYAHSGKTDQGLKLLDSAASSGPNAYSVLMAGAAVREQKHDILGAVAAYEKALALSPSSPAVQNNLAWLLSENNIGSAARALDLAQRAHALAPKDPQIADTYGWILYRTRSYDAAAAVLSEAAAALPDDGRVQYHLGATLARTGDIVGARRALTKAVGAADFPEKTNAQQELARLK